MKGDSARPRFPFTRAPERERVLALLRKENRPAGMTTVEIDTVLARGCVHQTNSFLGRLAQYGFLRKIPSQVVGQRYVHELNRWTLR